MIISFNPAHVYWIRVAHATLPTAHIAPHVLSERVAAHPTLKHVPFARAAAGLVQWLWQWAAHHPSLLPAFLGATGVSTYSPFMTPEIAARVHAAGLTTNVWTVNCEHEAARLRALKVNAITTDVPAALLSAAVF
eukprot:TRINITY_DN8133_c0_g5_i1.p3 TRINITY_DN8133_c0_g5~~TRINITY_DN8133_c0_g5_i1.p3  ORF type:complete len:135 (+),score=33.03 TRINITY_DN8133_c0_g5_i1:585-989(+)